jgi:hypothetical protein
VAAPTGPFPRQQALQWGLVQQTGQQPTGPREVAKHNQTHGVHCKPLCVMFPIHRRGLSCFLIYFIIIIIIIVFLILILILIIFILSSYYPYIILI